MGRSDRARRGAGFAAANLADGDLQYGRLPSPFHSLAHRPLPSAERVEPVVLPPYVGPADLRRIAGLRARETMRARARAAFIRDSIAMAESNRAAFVRDSTGNAELARLQEIRKRVERVIWFENDRQIPMSYRSIADDVAETLRAVPAIRVRLLGEVQNGTLSNERRSLSLRLVEIVRAYLVQRGVEGDRIVAAMSEGPLEPCQEQGPACRPGALRVWIRVEPGRDRRRP